MNARFHWLGGLVMLDFSLPWALLGLGLVPLVLWRWHRRTKPALPFSSIRLLNPLGSFQRRWPVSAGLGLWALGLSFLVVALAGPRLPDAGSRLPTEGIGIEILLDVSGSMAETDFEANGRKESRLSAAKRACQTFIAERPDDLIGLIAFANWPHTICPLTLSHSVLQEMLHDQANPRLAPQSIPNESRTNLGDALAWALHRFSTSQAKRNIIVLISDGEHNVPPPALSPDQAAQLAANQRIPIYVIDVGTANPDSARGRDALVSIAERTGGRYYLATETNSLADAWNAISQLERSTIESFQYRRYWELSHFVGVAALVCCVAIVALQSTVWLRVP